MGSYILKVLIASILCGLIQMLFLNEKYLMKILKPVTGVVVMITVLSPVVNADRIDFGNYFEKLAYDQACVVSDAERAAQEERALCIKQMTSSYILDKADSLNANLQVDVTVSEGAQPIPVSVILCGDISPYARTQLKNIIRNDLGIPEENQEWI